MSRVLQALRQLETPAEAPGSATAPKRLWLPERVARLTDDARGRSRLEKLADGMLHEFPARWGGSIYLVSPRPNSTFADSVATVAATLAERAAEPVLMIDADPRDKWLSRSFGIEGTPGMTEALNLNQPALDLALPVGLHQLAIMPAGRGVLGASPRTAITTLVESVRRKYRFVLVAGGSPHDELAASLARQSDATYLVVELDASEVAESRAAAERLQSVGARLLGAIAIRPW